LIDHIPISISLQLELTCLYIYDRHIGFYSVHGTELGWRTALNKLFSGNKSINGIDQSKRIYKAPCVLHARAAR